MMKTMLQQPERAIAADPSQIALCTHAEAVIGRSRPDDDSRLQTADLGQAHWTAVGKLTPGLIHEINNALCVVGNYLQLLMLERERRGWDILKPLTAMSSSLERAQTVTRRIAAYAREKAHPPSVIRVNDLMEAVLALASVQRPFREIEICKLFDANLPEIAGESRSLTDAFVELLTIDGQTSVQGKIITISTRSAPGWVMVTLSVADRAWPCSEVSVDLARRIIEQQGGRVVRNGGSDRAGDIWVWLRASAGSTASPAT